MKEAKNNLMKEKPQNDCQPQLSYPNSKNHFQFHLFALNTYENKKALSTSPKMTEHYVGHANPLSMSTFGLNLIKKIVTQKKMKLKDQFI